MRFQRETECWAIYLMRPETRLGIEGLPLRWERLRVSSPTKGVFRVEFWHDGKHGIRLLTFP